jgi:hypothetical protein
MSRIAVHLQRRLGHSRVVCKEDPLAPQWVNDPDLICSLCVRAASLHHVRHDGLGCLSASNANSRIEQKGGTPGQDRLLVVPGEGLSWPVGGGQDTCVPA